MQQSKLRDNEQVIVSYIAGLMDSDGHISIGRLKNRDSWRYRYQVYFCNTDVGLINQFTKFLEDRGMNFYIRTRKKPRSHHLTQYEVSLTKMEKAHEFLSLVTPHLKGMKHEYANLVIEFISSRLERRKNKSKRSKLGRFVKGSGSTYLDDEIKLYKKYKELREPQRLHAMPPPLAIQERVKT